jgi:predicted dehydrogenase
MLRAGVIGVGAVGQHHARVYAALPGVRLAAVADIVPERAAEVARSCGAEPHTEYRHLIGNVDVVSIATPTSLHAEIGEKFLRSGAHVLVEKPIASTLAEADRLIAAAAASGRVLQVGHVERFNPVVRAVREFVKRPRFFEAHRMGVFAPRSLDVDVVLDLMIHDLDIISLLVGSPPEEIQAVGIAILSRRIDIANARIRFADGCVANLTASRVSMEKIRKLRLFQEREYISLDYGLQQAAVFTLAPAESEDEELRPDRIGHRLLTPGREEPLETELRAFVAAARGETPVECTGADGKAALGLALRIRDLAEEAQRRETAKA